MQRRKFTDQEKLTYYRARVKELERILDLLAIQLENSFGQMSHTIKKRNQKNQNDT